ncbi:hypothetical protein [Vibrio algivorus]|uniref:Lipoprotein n=1 Tax=Vibrio algivorus TaxID=1667024 RepID=A0A557PFG5_9VIBR|nr:hypothetical protein [Vibrio algivorus]TVO39364.1 hypothetical protein FOF44_01895 [Vibrio algivorus]
MLKQLLLATTVCIALSACNDSSSSSSEPSESLTELNFSSLTNVSSIARIDGSNDNEGTHLIGFDSNGSTIGDISNVNVDKFTPVSNGGFIVEVTENHRSHYQYQNLGDSVEQHDPINHTYRKPVWYYVQTSTSDDGTIQAGEYFLISDNKDLPEFIGENSKGLLVFSNGETFNTSSYTRGHFYNNLKLNTESIIDAISKLTDENSNESIIEVLEQLIENKTLEKAKHIIQISGDTLLSTSTNLGDVLIETNKGAPASFSNEICNSDKLTVAQQITCKTVVIPAINSGVVSGLLGIDNKIKNLSNVNQILTVHNSELTLLNTGLLNSDAELDESLAGGWDGEIALNPRNQDDAQTLALSRSFNGKDCDDGNKQCLYSISETESETGPLTNKVKTLTSDFVINANTGFETGSEAGQIEGGQQNYLWVNDHYIVIKESTQISIIKREDNSISTILAGTEIDTINLTDDSQLYITATDSSGQTAAYIYDIASGAGLDTPITNEKLHAFKALIK